MTTQVESSEEVRGRDVDSLFEHQFHSSQESTDNYATLGKSLKSVEHSQASSAWTLRNMIDIVLHFEHAIEKLIACPLVRR